MFGWEWPAPTAALKTPKPVQYHPVSKVSTGSFWDYKRWLEQQNFKIFILTMPFKFEENQYKGFQIRLIWTKTGQNLLKTYQKYWLHLPENQRQPNTVNKAWLKNRRESRLGPHSPSYLCVCVCVEKFQRLKSGDYKRKGCDVTRGSTEPHSTEETNQ